MMSSPKVPDPKEGPSPPLIADANRTGSRFSSARSFNMSGVWTTPRGLSRSPLQRRNNSNSRRQFGGGA